MKSRLLGVGCTDANISRLGINKSKLFHLIVLASTIFASSNALAATMWTDWTDITRGNPGAASGTLGSITVDYSGEVIVHSVSNGSSNIWNPESTYVGGAVDASPDSVGDVVESATRQSIKHQLKYPPI
jgi:hypothetical protein